MELRQELHKVAALRREANEISKKAESLEAMNKQLQLKLAQYERIKQAEEIICRASSMDAGNVRYRAYTVEDFLAKRAALAKESEGFLKEASRQLEFLDSGRVSPVFLSDQPDHNGSVSPEDALNDLLEQRLNY